MKRSVVFIRILACLCALLPALTAGAQRYPVRGRVIDSRTRQGVPYAAVVIAGQEQRGVSTDTAGHFTLPGVAPGICRFSVSSLGYKSLLSPEYIVSANTPFVEIELEPDVMQVEAVSVRPSPFRRVAESPVSMKIIGLGEIEKSPGSNRDVSRIVRSYPGVSFSPVGYRNDLIVRGGGPSENRFFMDGIEIPNINHFATQGASGGPVSIVNADLIREISFYTGAFPADRAGALSSVLDFRLRDGDPDRQTFKATLGASEAGVSGSGHIGEKTTYLFSLRQSYLQLLFRMLGLPFLPNYIDGQVKFRIRLSDRDELLLLGLAGIDDMRLNTDEKGEDAEYLLSYLPRLKQETFTVGASYRRFSGRHTLTVTLSHNYLNNRNVKYRNNDESSEDYLTLRSRAVEQKSTLRAENRSYFGRWTLREGAEVNYLHYADRTLRRLYTQQAGVADYRTRLGIVGWGAFAGADYRSADDRLSVSGGLRFDGCDWSGRTARLWERLSPRLSFSYALGGGWSVGASTGLYYQLPPLTALGFRDGAGVLVNRDLGYMRVAGSAAGFDWRLRDRLVVSVEGFYKYYTDIPLSVTDGIPLTCKGNDYGTVGDEPLVSSAEGRAYGVEAMVRWRIPGKISLVGSATLYRSEFRRDRRAEYIPSAWDSRFVVNLSGTYDLPRAWSVGAKLSAVGRAPYTPYDVEKSSLKEAWDASGRPYYDYSQYNRGRLDAFAQLDVRVDKTFYFRRCMLGVYLDLQNVTGSKLRQPDVLMSTGVVENPSAPVSEQRYRMKCIGQVSGSLVPAVGLTVEF